MGTRVNGFVKWFDGSRGYGFAIVDGDKEEKEYFLHFSVINMEGYKILKSKQKISFVLKDTDKGIQATEVELL